LVVSTDFGKANLDKSTTGDGCLEVEVGTIEFVGGIDAKVAVDIGVSVETAVVSGTQETETIASKTMSSFCIFIMVSTLFARKRPTELLTCR
jgi:hypothetical protein